MNTAKPDYHTTDKDFELFKQECQKWIEFWGLHSWRVVYKHEDVGDSMGTCLTKYSGKIATISLNTILPHDCHSSTDIRRTAFHEIDELRLSRMDTCARYRGWCGEDFDSARHEVIRQDENKIFLTRSSGSKHR